MAGDQRAGGGVEGARGHVPRRSNSQSEAIPTVEPEEVAGNAGPSKAEHAQPSQELPRNTATPSAAGLSRHPSCVGTSTPSAVPNGYFDLSADRRPLEPPVTKSTLSELDVTKIIHNPKLRHDINFDPELHFRPNLDGDKGRRKQEKANQFWKALREQLVDFVMDRPNFLEKHGDGDDWCLPSLLRAVKEIIQTLVPMRDRVYLDEGLNVDLLMQQFNKGIADLEKLASWLSQVLKSHCAPMRDEWVDEMYNELSNGNRTNDMDELVKGMRSLLSVLEAMKLDVANHQIRCLRPVLIEDTVHFEQRFFLKKIQARKLDIQAAKDWYRRSQAHCHRVPVTSAHQFGEMAVFFDGLSRLILPSTPEKAVPNTFLFDEERVMKLRADLLDAVNLELCMRLYDELERIYSRHGAIPSFLCDEQNLDGDNLGPSLTIDLNFTGNASSTPSSSRPSSLVISHAGSASSSPRSSWCLPTQSSDASESKRRARELYNSLVALLHTYPSASATVRWHSMAESLALQIFRNTNAPSSILPDIESRLRNQVCNLQDELFQQVEMQFHAKLMEELGRRVKEYRGLSGVSLFSVATGGRVPGPGRTWESSRERERERELENSAREAREEGGIDDMAVRLAHLGVLHWRVWSHMAYSSPDGGVSANRPPTPPSS